MSQCEERWCCCFDLEFEEDCIDFALDFTECGCGDDMGLDFGELIVIHTDPPLYPGPYVVIPKRRDQILDTKNKTMADDVTVKEVPWIEVSNPEGTTYIIASD